MRVTVEALGPAREPHMRANHEQILVMQAQFRSPPTYFDGARPQSRLASAHAEELANMSGS